MIQLLPFIIVVGLIDQYQCIPLKVFDNLIETSLSVSDNVIQSSLLVSDSSPLITNHFFEVINAPLHNEISQVMIHKDMDFEPFSIPFGPTVDISVFDIKGVQFDKGSGFSYDNQKLKYWAKLNLDIQIEYGLNRLVRKYGTFKGTVTGLTLASALRLTYDKEKEALQPVFDQLDVQIDDLKYTATHKIYEWIGGLEFFERKIREAVSGKIEDAIKEFLPTVLKQASKKIINTPDGSYELTFVASPSFISQGIVLHLGLQKEASTSSGDNTLPVEGFNRTLPDPLTDIQPLFRTSLLQDIKPIILETIELKAGLAEIESDEPINVDVPMTSMTVNITKFDVDEKSIVWNPDTAISFTEGAIHTDIIVSFKFLTTYETSSNFLPSGSVNGTVDNLRINTDMGFTLKDGTLQPEIKSLTVSLEKVDISSSSQIISILGGTFEKIIKEKISALVSKKLQEIIPSSVSKLLGTELNIPKLGSYKLKVLTAPEIKSGGMLVNMQLVPAA